MDEGSLENTFDDNQYVKIENGFESNPWAVEDASVFLKYCCPECDYQILNYNIFSTHALENHEKAIVLFGTRTDVENIVVKREQVDYDEIKVDELPNVDNIDPLLEVKSEKFPCHICEKQLTSNAYLTIHLSSIHNVKPSIDPHLFKCKKRKSGKRCNYSHKSKTNVERHSMAAHKAHFFCQTCGKILEKNESIRSHFAKSNGCKATKDEFKQKSVSKRLSASVHDVTKPHKCPICGGGFSRKDVMKNHIAKVHERKKPYACDKTNCGALFGYKTDLTDHIASVHEGKRPYICKICDMKYSAKSGLRKHIKNIHADKLPLNFGIDAINELINDDAVEIPKKLKLKKHKCDFCELVFDHMSYLKKHIATAHEVKVSCEICFLDCESSKQLKKHMKKKHQIGALKCCPHCEHKNKYMIRLKKHIDENHPEHGEKKHMCSVCGKGFIFEASCRIHEANIHEKFPCHICGKQLSTKYFLEDHLNSIHKLEQNEHVCEICGFSALSKVLMQRHRLIQHVKKDRNKCPHCEFQSYKLDTMHVHIDSKHSDHDKKTVFCDHCSKSFIFAASLTKHMNNLKTMAIERAKKEIKRAMKSP